MEGSPFAPAPCSTSCAARPWSGCRSARARRGRGGPSRRPRALWPAAARAAAAAAPLLHLLVRTAEQLDAALELRPASITLDYLDLYGLRPRSSACARPDLEPRVASPRVLKPGEERIVDFLLGCDCPILVRSAGLLQALGEGPHPALVGDFSLNAANALTARELLARGLELAHAHARPQRRAGGRAGAPHRRGPHRGRGLPAPARLPHRALRLLPLPLHRHELPRLRPSLREAPRGAARSSRPRASRDGRRGLPQHRLRRRGAAGRRAPGGVAGRRHPPLPPGIRARIGRPGDARHARLRRRPGGPAHAARAGPGAPAHRARRHHRGQPVRAAKATANW